ncbi:tripartite tricarboxylate transporter TctB family protein [Salinicola lusitanus]|uniref:Tripartite tricarboxylate transporter TctB family protein n=1 Tax=Salinicola lusitanus TaxID=1949085 RepID=A0ABZ3CWL3_9GAMM
MKPGIESSQENADRRVGVQTLITSGLLLVALAGLFTLSSQVTVFDFGDSGPDARFFPRLVLALLALMAGLRLWRHRHALETALGSARDWSRTLFAVVLIGVAIAAMNLVGFLASAAMVGILLSWLLGERRLSLSVVLPLVVAALVTLSARQLLNLPLP